ncbi:MAG: hypothetical protein ACXAC7_17345 [Candidatus Hodarchaeales archaeon]
MSIENEISVETSEMLSRLGWKWAVLAFTIGKIYNEGEYIPTKLLNKIKIGRTKIESGCYSSCEIACDLSEIEAQMMPILSKFGINESDKFLSLISKALNGSITENELDLSSVQPVLLDCLTLPCVCHA